MTGTSVPHCQTWALWFSFETEGYKPTRQKKTVEIHQPDLFKILCVICVKGLEWIQLPASRLWDPGETERNKDGRSCFWMEPWRDNEVWLHRDGQQHSKQREQSKWQTGPELGSRSREGQGKAFALYSTGTKDTERRSLSKEKMLSELQMKDQYDGNYRMQFVSLL